MQADGSGVVVHAVNLHQPPVNGQFHANGDIFRRAAFLDDFIGRVSAAFRVRPRKHHAFSVFQQLFQDRLPAIRTGDGNCPQIGDFAGNGFSSQGRRGFFCVRAVKEDGFPHLNAYQLVRMRRFEVQVFLYIGRKVRLVCGSCFRGFLCLPCTRAGGFRSVLRRREWYDIAACGFRLRIVRNGRVLRLFRLWFLHLFRLHSLLHILHPFRLLGRRGKYRRVLGR